MRRPPAVRPCLLLVLPVNHASIVASIGMRHIGVDPSCCADVLPDLVLPDAPELIAGALSVSLGVAGMANGAQLLLEELRQPGAQVRPA